MGSGDSSAETQGSIQLLDVSCNHCGAPRSVPGETKFLTCTYCGARLELLRSGGAVYTQALANIEQRTEQLDREWMVRRQKLMSHNKNGSTSVPTTAGAIAGSVVMGVGAIFFFIMSANNSAGPFSLIGVAFVLIAIVGGIYGLGKAARYREAEQAYRQQRQQLQNELDRM